MERDPAHQHATENRGDKPEDRGDKPEGFTSEAPTRDELGKAGTPAAGLTGAAPHAADAEHGASSAHGTPSSGAAHDDHGTETLGPINWRAWGAAALGLVIALGIALLMALPTLPR